MNDVDYGLVVNTLQKPSSGIFSSYGYYLSDKEKHIVFVHPSSIVFSNYNKKDLKADIVFEIQLHFTVMEASKFPNSFIEGEENFERIALYTTEHQLIICSFHDKFRTSIASNIRPHQPISSGNTPILVGLQDYFVLFYFPTTFYIIVNDDKFVASEREIDHSLSPTSISCVGNTLYMNSLSSSFVHSVDIDFYYSNQTREYDEEEEEIFVQDIYKTEEIIEYVYADSKYIDLFTQKSFLRVSYSGELKESYILPIDSLVTYVIETPQKSLYIFFELGDVYEFINGEFKFTILGSQAKSPICLDERAIFLSSVNGPSIFLRDGKVFNLYSSPLIETLAVMPESKNYPKRIIGAGGAIFGIVDIFGTCLRPKAVSRVEFPDVSSIFGIGDSVLCSSETETKILGKPVTILKNPTNYAEKLKNGYVQVTNDLVLFANLQKNDNSQNVFENVNDLIAGYNSYQYSILKADYAYGNIYKDYLVLYSRSFLDIFDFDEQKVLHFDVGCEIASAALSEFIYVSTWKEKLIKMDWNGNILQTLDYLFTSLQVCQKFIIGATSKGRVIVFDENFNIVKEVSISTTAIYLSKHRDETCVLAFSDKTNIIIIENDNVQFVRLVETNLVAAAFFGDRLVVSEGTYLSVMDIKNNYEFCQTSLVNVPGTALNVVPLSDDSFIVLIDDNTCVLYKAQVYLVAPLKGYEFPQKEIMSSLASNGKYHFVAGQIMSDEELFNETGVIYTFAIENDNFVVKHKREFPLAATDIVLNGDRAYASIGGCVYIFKIEEDGSLTDIRCYDAGVSAMRLRIDRGNLVVFDVCQSIKIFKIINKETFSRKYEDNRHRITTAAIFVNDTDILMSDGDGYLRLMRCVDTGMVELSSMYFGYVFNDFVNFDSMKDRIIPRAKYGENFIIGGTSNGALFAIQVVQKEEFAEMKRLERECIGEMKKRKFIMMEKSSDKSELFLDAYILERTYRENTNCNFGMNPDTVQKLKEVLML